MTKKALPQSENFTYHELAGGVWAAIVITSGLAASNSGIVDLGDSTLIFDTTFSTATAKDHEVCEVGLPQFVDTFRWMLEVIRGADEGEGWALNQIVALPDAIGA